MIALEDTKEFVRKAHAGQVDKGGKPYHEHVERVALRVGAKIAALGATRFALPDDVQRDILHAALAHDVVEDTPYTFDDLIEMGYSQTVLGILRLVTRDRSDGLSYQQWVQSIADSGNLGAILVKLSDNEDNADPARIAQLDPENQGVVDRYTRSMEKLHKALKEMGLEP